MHIAGVSNKADTTRSALAAPTSAEIWVARDKADLLYAHGLGGLVINAIACAILTFSIITPPLSTKVLAWDGCLALVLLLRLFDITMWHPARRAASFEGKLEIGCYAVGALAAAILWAAFPIVFFPMIGGASRTATSVVLAALAGGSATVLGPCLPLAITYCATLLLPVSIMFLSLPGRDNFSLGLLGLSSVAAMFLFSRISSKSVVGALRVSRLNQVLVAETEMQRRGMEVINEELRTAQVALKEVNQTLEERIEDRTANLAQEILERKRYAEALALLASTDPLTGLHNRTTFVEHLTLMLTQAEQSYTQVALLFLDLDDFKLVNDARGHQTGDWVLKTAAMMLCERLHGPAELARWGGDEFVIALPAEKGPATAIALAQELHDAFEAPMVMGFEVLRMGLTIGIAMFPDDGRECDSLIRAADIAMYEAKKEGKGQLKIFDPGLAYAVAERHLLEQSLQNAIANNELSLSSLF